MKTRHNKKRNTAFVYESLIKEATVAILKNDVHRRDKVVKIIKKHFGKDSILRRDLECYRSLYEEQRFDKDTSMRILREAKLASRVLDVHGLFVKQSDLITDVNTELSPTVFNNFVPNYKTLATIAQIFSGKLSPKQAVILENQIVDNMCKMPHQATPSSPVDNLVYQSLANKFNEKYHTNLLLEQKELLNYFISSFADNSLALKTFLNSEIARLKNCLTEALSISEIATDTAMTGKATQIIEKLNGLYTEDINESVLLTVLKTQMLVQEIFDHGNKS